MLFIAYAFRGQVHVFAGQVKIVSHLSCRTSAIFRYFCPLAAILYKNHLIQLFLLSIQKYMLRLTNKLPARLCDFLVSTDNFRKHQARIFVFLNLFLQEPFYYSRLSLTQQCITQYYHIPGPDSPPRYFSLNIIVILQCLSRQRLSQ